MSDDAKTDAGSGGPPPASESIRSWLDVIAKLIGAVAIAGVTYVGYTYQSKASLSSVINQREQAESQLRASMLSDLVEPIIGKNGAVSDAADLQRQRLLAEMVTLNFHDHFEFKPLLLEVDGRLLKAHDTVGHGKIASDARRVIDRQINMLTSIEGVTRNGRTDGYKAKITRIDLVDPTPSKSLNKASQGNCTTEGDIVANKPSLTEPTSICVTSPDKKVCLLLRFGYPDYPNNSVVMGSKIIYPDSTAECNINLDNITTPRADIKQLDEAHLSIFDFPLTDNSKIMWDEKEYRYSVSLYQIDNDRITLKLVWFPQGYVTERERPTQYAGLR